MSLPKFFIPEDAAQQGFLVLTGDNAEHARVLRLRCGDGVTVCDGSGADYDCTVSDVSPGRISLVVRGKTASSSEPAVFCSVYMAFPKQDKLEHVIQKATELGACEIVAFPSARCVSKPDESSLPKKLERWQKIAAAAAGQSGRGRIPQVSALGSFREAVERAAGAELPLFPYEIERALTLRAAVRGAPFRSASVMTGPEGGFTPEEAEFARAAGLRLCTLGPRILRCETAPLCALTAVLYDAGAFD